MSYYLSADWRASGNNSGITMPNGPAGFCTHHSAGTSLDMAPTFLKANTSAHYGIKDYNVVQFVEDRRAAWHCGDSWGNRNLLSIECVNSGGSSQGWPISETTIDTLVLFLSDKCKEYNIPSLIVGVNLFGHKDFYNTFCPGVLYPRLDEIASRVNSILGGDDMTPEEFWTYTYNGKTMAERLFLCNVMDYSTEDPTGRGMNLNTHDHVKWIAGLLQDMYKNINRTNQILEKLAENMGVDIPPQSDEKEND